MSIWSRSSCGGITDSWLATLWLSFNCPCRGSIRRLTRRTMLTNTRMLTRTNARGTITPKAVATWSIRSDWGDVAVIWRIGPDWPSSAAIWWMGSETGVSLDVWRIYSERRSSVATLVNSFSNKLLAGHLANEFDYIDGCSRCIGWHPRVHIWRHISVMHILPNNFQFQSHVDGSESVNRLADVDSGVRWDRVTDDQPSTTSGHSVFCSNKDVFVVLLPRDQRTGCRLHRADQLRSPTFWNRHRSRMMSGYSWYIWVK